MLLHYLNRLLYDSANLQYRNNNSNIIYSFAKSIFFQPQETKASWVSLWYPWGDYRF